MNTEKLNAFKEKNFRNPSLMLPNFADIYAALLSVAA